MASQGRKNISRHQTSRCLFSLPSRWTYSPESPGLYRGWESSAWISLQMAIKGKMQLESSFFHRLERALTRVVDIYPLIKPGGSLVGPGGAFIVATLATPFSSRVRPFLKPLLDIWKRKKVPY